MPLAVVASRRGSRPLCVRRVALGAMPALLACAPAPAPPTAERIVAFARDSMPLDSLTNAPSDSALEALLDRLGIRRDPVLAVVDTGCARGGAGRPVAQPARVSCRMRGEGHALDVELLSSRDGYPQALRVRSPDGGASQELALDAEPPGGEAPFLFAVDLDADGTRELLARRYRGATGNTAYQVWRYDPPTRRLTADSAMTEMASPERWPGRRCVWEMYHGGGDNRSYSLACVREGRWRDVWSVSVWQDPASRVVTRTVQVRVADSLRLARLDTVPSFVDRE
jgi:hypothetical protein